MKKYLFLFILAIFYLLPTVADAGSIGRPSNNLGLIGYWSFNEGTSTKAGDFSGTGNTGTLTGTTLPAWVDGKRGKALDFDGSSGYVDLFNPSSLYATGDVTLSAWVYPHSLNSSQHKNWIVSGRRTETSPVYGLQVAPTGIGISFQTDNLDNGSLGYVNKLGTVTINLNEWVHVSVVRDGTDLYFYKNGVLIDQDSFSAGNLYATNGYLIGRGYNGGTFYFDGVIDEVRIYSRALSQSEMATLYENSSGVARANSSQTSITSGLVGWWTGDGKDTVWTSATAGSAIDKSGTSNNGTLTGMTRATSTTAGKVGQAFNFDGGTGFVNLGNTSSLQIEQGTILAWIKTSNAGASYRGIIQKGSAYGLYLLSNVFGVYDNGASTFRTTGVSLNDNEWHHVAAVLDSGVAGGTHLYIDGEFVTSVDQTVTSQGSSAVIARGQGGVSQAFAGAIDDARIYNRMLSAAEIKEIYNETVGSKVNKSTTGGSLDSGLIGYWSFNGADVTDKVYDRSGEGNNGYFFGSGTTATTSAKTIGKIGQALQFNGTNEYVATYPNSVDTGNSASFSVWVKPGPYPTDSGIHEVYRHTHLDASNTGGYIFSWRGDVDSKWDLGVREADSNNRYPYRPSTSEVPAGAWTHVVVTADGTNVRTYINGTQVGSALSYDGTIANGRELVIGAFASGTGVKSRFFNGIIDELRIYNRSLSASEVTRLYNMGR